MTLTDLQAIAARSDYLIRVTLDYLYIPYNNWSSVAGQSASDLAQLLAYLDTWPRNRLLITQPVGEFQACDLCDLKTLLYLMYQRNGWGKPSAYGVASAVNPGTATTLLDVVLSPDVRLPVTPSFGVNEPTFIITAENGAPILLDNPAPLPCFRDWVALGLGSPPV